MEKKCSCTGHRPQKFPFEYGGRNKEFQTYLKELESKIKAAITEYGVTCFISGMALGVDLDFAEIVLKLRKKYSLKLECAIPCPNQTIKWDKFELHFLVENSDIIGKADLWYLTICVTFIIYINP